MVITGGLSEIKQKDDKIQKMIEDLKKDIEDKLEKKISLLEVHSYKTQVVAGTNYFIKVHIGNNTYIMVRCFEDLPHNNSIVKLIAIEKNKKESDLIDYFI